MDIEALAKQLLAASESIKETTANSNELFKKSARLSFDLEVPLNRLETLNKDINSNLETIRLLNTDTNSDIQYHLNRMVDTAFENNKRKIQFSIENTTKALFYTLIGVVLIVVLSLSFMANKSLKQELEAQRTQIIQQGEALEYMNSNNPKSYKVYLESLKKK